MSEENGTDEKASSPLAKKMLSLKRSVETGSVRQNFSHGRTKSVVVETKRKRVSSPGGPKLTETVVRKTVAKKPTATPEPEAPKEKPRKSSSMVLQSLSENEKDARAKALIQAREREKQEKIQAEEDARHRAEEEINAVKESEKAARRKVEEAARRKADEAAKAREAEEAAAVAAAMPVEAGRSNKPTASSQAPAPRREENDDRRKSKGKSAARNRGEPRQRQQKLTITAALEGNEERVRSLTSFKRQKEREKREHEEFLKSREKVAREVQIPEAITVGELANRMAERGADVVKELMKMDVMATITQTVDADTAQLVAEAMGHTVRRVAESDVEEGIGGKKDDPVNLQPRPPVVTVMGHVDHGKTSLLDALRKADVVSGEAGGITQHIGAYQVRMDNGEAISFLDTPGHAAFTAMRQRGARATDIVILVVAADDGVMPQTIEAINHSKAAGVPMIIAINKIDKEGSDASRVRNELLQHEVVVESMGGDVQEVEVSALKKMGLDKLLEAIALQAEILELTANPDRSAEGVVIEAKLDKGRGAVGTLLVQRGTLNVGDIVVGGAEWGKVRALMNDRGERVDQAGSSVPVEVLGLGGVPNAGDDFAVVESEGRAREITEYRIRKRKEAQVAPAIVSLDQLMSQMKEGELHTLPIVLKADVHGSVEAITAALEKLGTEEVQVRVLHGAVGGIAESDIQLAGASNAPVIGFNVRANKQARDMSEVENVEIRYYSIIYDLVDDIKAAMEGMLSPERRETFIGYAEILEIFNITKVGKIAGCKMTEGVARREAGVRLLRDDTVIYDGKLKTLKRFKDEVKEVQTGQECGMAFERYEGIQVGDVIEIFKVEEIQRKLEG